MIEKLRQLMVELHNEAKAIIEKADAEKRDLTDDEVNRNEEIDAEFDATKVKIEQREKLEARGKDLEATKGRKSEPVAPKAEDRTDPSKVKVTQKRYGKLKAFKTEEAAYRSGMWLRSVLYGDQNAAQWCSENGLEVRALGGGTNTAGGYLVPEEFMQTLIDLREEYGVFRRECRVVPMGRDTMSIPRRQSGVSASWYGENATVSDSDPAWGQVQLTAKKLGVMTRVGSEVAEDAIIDLAEWCAQEHAYEFSQEEDSAGFNGDGTSSSGGIFGVTTKVNDGTHTASVYDAASGNDAFGNLDLVDFHGCMGSLPLYALRSAKWYISQPGFADSMQRLAYAGGGNTTDNISGKPQLSFLGYPVVLSQTLNTTLGTDASAIKLLFGDLSLAATLGDRRSIDMQADASRYFELDQIAIRTTERLDIQVHDLGDNTNAGPIVAIKTAS